MRVSAALAVMWCAAGMPPARAQAQVPTRTARGRPLVTAVRQYIAGEAVSAQLAPPSNIALSSHYRQLFETMLRRSSTFRRQCVRIAAEHSLTVDISLVPPSWPSHLRATTYFTRQPDGRRLAHIRVTPSADVVELIAHELEHVIEQLDGVDLADLASRPGTGVQRQAGLREAFETMRATRVGRQVTSEVRGRS